MELNHKIQLKLVGTGLYEEFSLLGTWFKHCTSQRKYGI